MGQTMSDAQATLSRIRLNAKSTATVRKFNVDRVSHVGSLSKVTVIYRQKYNPKMVRKLLRLKKEGPIAVFDNAKEALKWLDRP